MNKYAYILCLLCSTLTLPMTAQDFGVWNPFSDPHRPSQFLQSIERVLVHKSQNRQKLPWVQAVEHQLHQATPQGLIGLKLDYILPQTVPAVPEPIQAQYQARMRAWTQAATKNPVLGRFTLKTPRPQDATRMSETQTAYLTRFFQQALTGPEAKILPVRTEEFKHYIVRLTFQVPQEERTFHLVLNCYTKEMFLAFGNADLPDIPLEPLTPTVRHY